MEKRFLLALFLSAIVLVVWTITHPPPPRPQVESVAPGGPTGVAEVLGGAGATGGEGPAEAVEVEEPTRIEPLLAEEEERAILFFGEPGQPGYWRAVFSNRGARLVELRTGDYFSDSAPEDARDDVSSWTPVLEAVAQPDGRETGSLLLAGGGDSSAGLLRGPLEEALWQMEVDRSDTTAVRFTYGPGTGVVFTKTVRPVPGTWELAVELGIENVDAVHTGNASFMFTPAGCVLPALDDRFYPEPSAVAAGPLSASVKDMKLSSEVTTSPVALGDEVGALAVPGRPAYAGVHNKYFACLFRGADPESALTLDGALYRHVRDEAWEGDPREAWTSMVAEVGLALKVPWVGERATWDYLVYAGPKDSRFSEGYAPFELVHEEDLGWFSGIGNLLLFVMRMFHGWFGNWGVAIILLTICVRVLLFPLNRRSQTAMARYQKKMKRVQPMLTELKEKYESDPKKQREEQARIMQEEGAFPPLGGCLPIFFQIPVFFALFGMLRTTFDLRQAPFVGWIDDLSRPDRMMRIDLELPGFLPDIEYLNVLPILMVVLWVLQQLGMPKPADEQAARMQKMMMFMPVVMGIFLYDYASGLSVYMCTQSLLGIIEQKIIKKLWPVDDTEVVKKRGCGPFSGFAEKLAEAQKEQMRLKQQQQRARARTSKQKAKRRRK